MQVVKHWGVPHLPGPAKMSPQWVVGQRGFAGTWINWSDLLGPGQVPRYLCRYCIDVWPGLVWPGGCGCDVDGVWGSEATFNVDLTRGNNRLELDYICIVDWWHWGRMFGNMKVLRSQLVLAVLCNSPVLPPVPRLLSADCDLLSAVCLPAVCLPAS